MGNQQAGSCPNSAANSTVQLQPVENEKEYLDLSDKLGRGCA